MVIHPFLTASQILQQIQAGQVSVFEVLERLLERIEQHNPALNAIVTLDAENARRRAREADDALARGERWGPLHGLPVTIKDAFETERLRSTCSYPPLTDNVPDQDAAAVARLRDAGAIVVGKTNLPPLASDFQTVSPIFGRTNNPWDLNRTPGGSTGGGGAAVAAGLSYLELGSDLAGSIRIPAHFCGVFGFVPTVGRVPREGHLPRQEPGNRVGEFLRVGSLARSVADLRLVFQTIAGPYLAEPDLPPVALGESQPRRLQSLRIGWYDDLDGAPLTSEVRAALTGFAQSLAACGCHVERCAPPDGSFALARQIHNRIFMTAMGAMLPPIPRLMGRYLGGVRAFGLDLKDYLQAETQKAMVTAQLDAYLGQWDAWLCPVTATVAFPHHPAKGNFGGVPVYRDPIEMDGMRLDYYAATNALTIPFNVTGHPVVVIPIGRSKEGLPVGVQVVGGRWRDMALLDVAEALSTIVEPVGNPAL